MQSAQISLNDCSYTSLMLLALGLATVMYLVQVRTKSAATWLLAGAYASFAMAALAMFVTSSLVLWGHAIWPAQYALALVGLAMLVQFAFRFPDADQPRKARTCLYASILVILPVIGFTVYTAEQFLTRQAYTTGLEETFPLLLAVGTLAAIGVFLQRAVHLSLPCRPARAGLRSTITGVAISMLHPPNRHVGALRNFGIGLVFALLAGIAYPLTYAHLLSRTVAAFVLSVGILASLASMVLVYIGNGTEPTSFIVKLIIVSLVVNLVTLGVLGLWVTGTLDSEYLSEKGLEAAIVDKALRANDLTGLPDSVAYVAACPPACTIGCFECGVELLYAVRDGPGSEAGGQSSDGLQFLVEEDRLRRIDVGALTPFANADSYKLAEHTVWPSDQVAMRYGRNPVGTIHEYMGLRLEVAGVWYEVGFRLSEYRAFVHARILALLGLVALSCAATLVVFPWFLNTNLVRPLQALLEGVRQVNAGNLNVAVPMQMGDEIGFLAYSFTGMVDSIRALHSNLRREISERQRAEGEVRALNATLEQRVAEQTRELSALFNVSAVASQAHTLETLMERSLDQTMAAIRSVAGIIYLRDGVVGGPDSPWLQMVAQRGIPSRLMSRSQRIPSDKGLVGWVLEAREPLLVPDLSKDSRAPAPIWGRLVRTCVVAPLRAGGEALGVFGLFRRRDEPFDQDEVSLLASIADQVGLAVEGHRLRKVAEQTAVLAERQRLARDMHDSITQYLYSLNLLAEAGQAQLETGAVSLIGNTFAQIGRTTRQALKEIRLFIQQLRPAALEQTGLVGALHQRLASVEGRANVQSRLLVDEAIVLPAQVEEALYHIASEALNNTLKHADADTVTVHLRQEGDKAVLSVVDNGCGFDPSAMDGTGMGLESMNERAKQVGGAVQIVSAPGTGTMVSATVPIVAPASGK